MSRRYCYHMSQENLVKIKSMLLGTILISSFAANAMAMDKGDWLFRFGGSYVDPKSNNHALVSVDSASQFTFT